MSAPVIQLVSTTNKGVHYKPTLFNKPTPPSSTNTTTVISIIKPERLVNNIATRFTCVQFDSRHERLASVDNRGTIYLLDLKRNYYHILSRAGVQCHSLLFLQSNLLLCGGADGVIRVYDIDSDTLVLTLRGHTAPVHHAYATDKHVITSSADCTIMWSLYNEHGVVRDYMQKVKTIEACVKQCVFAHNNAELYTLTDNTIHVWSASTFSLLYTMTVPFEQQAGSAFVLTCMCMTENNEYVVAGGDSNVLYVFHLASNQLIHTIYLPLTVFTVTKLITVSHTPLHITALASDGAVYVVDTETLQHTCLIQPQPTNHNTDYTISHSLHHIAAITGKGTMRLYNCDDLLTQLRRPYNIRQPAVTIQPVTPARAHVSAAPLTSTPLLSPNRTPHNLLDIHKLRRMLDRYGQYPHKHRLLIYRYLLQLPENTAAYHSLAVQGIHPQYNDLYTKYPIKSQRLFRRLQILSSAFAWYDNMFAVVEYWPVTLFPFVKSLAFANDEVVFELVLTFVFNICSRWFELYPHPPAVLLNACDQLLHIHDAELHAHLHDTLRLSSTDIFWSHIYTVYQNNLTADNWLVLLDYLLCDEPAFYYYTAVAYVLHNRSAALNCHTATAYHTTITNNINLNLSAKKLVLDAQTLRNRTTFDTHRAFVANTIGTADRPYTPEWSFLPSGQYVKQDFAPKFIVDYHLKQRQIIEAETKSNVSKQALTKQLQRDEAALRVASNFAAPDVSSYEQSVSRQTAQQNKLSSILQNTTNIVDYSLHQQRLHNLDAQNDVLQKQLNQIQRQNAVHKTVDDDRKYGEESKRQVDAQRQRVTEQAERVQRSKHSANQQLSADINNASVQHLVEQQKRFIAQNSQLGDALQQEQFRLQQQVQQARLDEIEHVQHELAAYNEQLKMKQHLDDTYDLERIRTATQRSAAKQKQDMAAARVDAIAAGEAAKLELLRQQNIAAEQRRQRADALIEQGRQHDEAVTRQHRQHAVQQVAAAELETMMLADEVIAADQRQRDNAFLAELNEQNHQQTAQRLQSEAELNEVLAQMQRQRLGDQGVVQRARMAADESDIRLAYQAELHATQLDAIQTERAKFAALRSELHMYMSEQEKKVLDKHERRMLVLLERRATQLARLRDVWRSGVRADETARLEAEYMVSGQQVEQYATDVQHLEEQLRQRFGLHSNSDDDDDNNSSSDTE